MAGKSTPPASSTDASPAARHGLAVTLPSGWELELRREFAAARTLVFDTWVQPSHVSRWMLGPDGWSMPVCEIDLRPGGAWHFVWRRGDGSEMEMHGEYREIDRPGRLVSTERWGGDWAETLNTLELSELNGRTIMVLNLRYPSQADRDRALETGMNDGAASSFERLAELLAGLPAPPA